MSAPSVVRICAQADDKLFNKILQDENHLLNTLLLSKRMSDASYELIYFPVRGRGAAILYLLKDQGVPCELRIVKGENWLAVKPTTPLGQLPVLKEGDFELGQSGAIIRYLASKHGLDGNTPKERAIADMIYSQHDDIRNSYVQMIYRNYEAGKEPFANDLPKTLAPLENFLSKNNGGDEFFVGDTIKYVDYSVFDLLDDLLILSPLSLDSLPKLKAFHARIAHRPNLKAYRETEEFKNTPVNGNGKQ